MMLPSFLFLLFCLLSDIAAFITFFISFRRHSSLWVTPHAAMHYFTLLPSFFTASAYFLFSSFSFFFIDAFHFRHIVMTLFHRHDATPSIFFILFTLILMTPLLPFHFPFRSFLLSLHFLPFISSCFSMLFDADISFSSFFLIAFIIIIIFYISSLSLSWYFATPDWDIYIDYVITPSIFADAWRWLFSLFAMSLIIFIIFDICHWCCRYWCWLSLRRDMCRHVIVRLFAWRRFRCNLSCLSMLMISARGREAREKGARDATEAQWDDDAYDSRSRRLLYDISFARDVTLYDDIRWGDMPLMRQRYFIIFFIIFLISIIDISSMPDIFSLFLHCAAQLIFLHSLRAHAMRRDDDARDFIFDDTPFSSPWFYGAIRLSDTWDDDASEAIKIRAFSWWLFAIRSMMQHGFLRRPLRVTMLRQEAIERSREARWRDAMSRAHAFHAATVARCAAQAMRALYALIRVRRAYARRDAPRTFDYFFAKQR